MPFKLIARFIDGDKPQESQLPNLPDVIEKARQEWIATQNYYNAVADQDLVDHAVYMMQAAEKKYMYLLKQARQAGITYSPYDAKDEKISNTTDG